MTNRYNKYFPGARDCKNYTHFHPKVIAGHDVKIQLKRAGFGDVVEIQAVSPAVMDRIRKRSSGDASSSGRDVGSA
jgi:hypothetical protein